MNQSKKTASCTIAALLTAVSAFGQNPKCPPKNMNQGEELGQNQYMAGYNAPARTDVRGSWDVYGTATFTYWQATQEQMELGGIVDSTNDRATETIVNQDFAFQPGFKVGLGLNLDYDNWDSFAEYTWFRSKNLSGTSVPQDNVSNVSLDPARAGDADIDGDVDTYYSTTQKWSVHMDLIDWSLARSYYSGSSLTFRPFMGARAAWIREYLNAKNLGHTDTAFASQNTQESSYSWAVGPRFGMNTQWLFCEGFRLFGNGAGSILYTRYTTNSQDSALIEGSTLNHKIVYHQAGLGVLRTALDLELGLGWGTYFDNNNWHIDFSAGYAFQVFFDQNVLRNQLATSRQLPTGNLYIQGLNLAARFDF